ncbi:hypothetical protein DENSPDRAFT_840126 [Dentipellis sp. KUC8613]|nr:hypothetical protein DENSPDRAFT_840126 [Dentipellis sp. KUC8613]
MIREGDRGGADGGLSFLFTALVRSGLAGKVTITTPSPPPSVRQQLLAPHLISCLFAFPSAPCSPLSLFPSFSLLPLLSCSPLPPAATRTPKRPHLPIRKALW